MTPSQIQALINCLKMHRATFDPYKQDATIEMLNITIKGLYELKDIKTTTPVQRLS